MVINMGAVISYFLLIIAVVGLDQGVKWYCISLHQNFDYTVIGNLLHFTFITNSGAAFSILQN